ncbi:hypothetical protein QCA50_010985 [Cerrena zonata]|uniref:F-box domain-containing protein n=1 Tax=Cerrena zonata TaxID=2478898 RepID=A0AAW0FXJ8_9APHY
MHHCLSIDEILQKIASSVAAYSLDDQHEYEMEILRMKISDKKSLLSFILTCRTFAEPGLDVLWSRLNNIFPLAFAFLPDVSPRLVRATDNLTETVIGLTRIPGPEDWIHFNRYARRLKTLIQSHDTPCNVDIRFLAEISLHRRTGNLFPNLSALCWRDSRQDHFPYISLFMGPSLTKVDIKIFSEDMYIAFWDLLRHSAPAIHDIHIDVVKFEVSDLALNSLTNALPSFKQLTKLCSPNALLRGGLELSPEQLVSLPSTLRYLQYRFRAHTNLGALQGVDATSEDRFPVLDTLKVHIYDSSTMDLLRMFMEHHKLPTLTTFIVFLYWKPLAFQLQQLFEALKDKSRLNSILLRCVSIKRIVFPQHLITDSMLTPLFAFDLIAFGLVDVPHKITRTSLSKMAESWPKLCSLVICTTHPSQTGLHDHIHVQDLDVFANKLPGLCSMRLTLDMSVTDKIKTHLSAHTIRRSYGMPELDIVNPRMPDTLAQTQIAAYVTSIFPNVHVKSPQTELETFITLIELFKSVRESERRKSRMKVSSSGR